MNFQFSFQVAASLGLVGFVCHGDGGLIVWHARPLRSLHQSSASNDCPLLVTHCPDLHYDFCVLGSFDGFWKVHQDLLYMPIEDHPDHFGSQAQVIMMMIMMTVVGLEKWKPEYTGVCVQFVFVVQWLRYHTIVTDSKPYKVCFSRIHGPVVLKASQKLYWLHPFQVSIVLPNARTCACAIHIDWYRAGIRVSGNNSYIQSDTYNVHSTYCKSSINSILGYLHISNCLMHWIAK